MQTSIHVRMNEATGKRFVKHLQDKMGYSVMPNGKKSYYMHNPSDGRVLIEEESSSDYVIKGFWPKFPGAEIVEFLEKTARGGHGDFYIDCNGNGDEVSIVQGVDAPQPSQVQAQTQAQPAPQAQQYQQPNIQPPNPVNANMDPAFYQKMIMDAAGKLLQMFAMGHMKAEDVYTQATRVQGAAWIMSGLQANFLTPQDVQQLMNDTKKAINDIPNEIAQAQQHYQANLQAQQQVVAQGGQTTYTPSGGQTGDPFAATQPNDPFDPGF